MSTPELISGAMVRSHILALHERLGVATYDQLVAQLSVTDRDQLLIVTPLSWVEIATVERLYGVLAKHEGSTIEKLHTEIASRVVGTAVTSIWRALLNLASDSMLIARSPTIFKRAYRQGKLDVASSGTGVAELRVSDWPNISDFALRGMRVGTESTLRAAGRQDPRGVSRRTSDGATIKLEWRSS